MYRKIEDKILDFIKKTPKRESSPDKKCLLIDGLRQIGKTYSIRKACGFPPDEANNAANRHSFDGIGEATCIYLALDRNQELSNKIEDGISPEGLLREIGLLRDFRSLDLNPSKENRIVMILDEIQLSKRGVNLLKYLSSIDGLTVIASGSMLGILKNTEVNFPMGYVETIRMYPMDFEEFMIAYGYQEKTIKDLIDCARNGMAIPFSVHEELSLLFKQYIMIGGLPYYVDKYKDRGTDKGGLFGDAQNQRNLYKADIALYGDIETRERGREIFDAIASSLGRSSNRFFYSDIKKGAKGREYKHPINWLLDCGLVYRIYNIKSPELPLGYFKIDDEWKLYYADNLLAYGGLGESLYGIVMDDAPSLAKGIIYENACADILYPLTNGNLYYYSRKSGLEVDFVLEIKRKACFVEIKSSDNSKSKSLSTAMKDYPETIGVRCSYRNNGKLDRLWSLPLYMLPFLDRIISD